MKRINPNAPKLIFSPHLLPVPRGILSTLYVPVSADSQTIQNLFESAYAGEPFIHVLPQGKMATLAHVVRSNRVAISVSMADDDMAIVVVTEDNLLKGASGQAVQDMNIMFGDRRDNGVAVDKCIHQYSICKHLDLSVYKTTYACS